MPTGRVTRVPSDAACRLFVAPSLGYGAPACSRTGAGSSAFVAALARDPGEQRPDLALAVAAVTTQRADGRELAGLRPARDRLGVDAEHRRDLSGREQRLGVGRASAHGVISLSGPQRQ